MNDPRVIDDELNSRRITSVPGATIDDARGVRSVQAETNTTLMILSLFGQFIGFSGSSGESQKTMLGPSWAVIADVAGWDFSVSTIPEFELEFAESIAVKSSFFDRCSDEVSFWSCKVPMILYGCPFNSSVLLILFRLLWLIAEGQPELMGNIVDGEVAF